VLVAGGVLDFLLRLPAATPLRPLVFHTFSYVLSPLVSLAWVAWAERKDRAAFLLRRAGGGGGGAKKLA
jgi:hypothetical protein